MRNLSRILILFFVLIYSEISFGDLDGFAVWQPEPNGIRYLIPRVTGETPSQTATRWLAAMKASKTYGSMQNAQKVDLSVAPERFSNLPVSTEKNPLVAVVLNRPNQMRTDDWYLKAVVGSFEKRGPNLLAIPVGLETAFKPKEMEQIRKTLNAFDGQLGVGGDDAHPATWGQRDLSRSEGDISWRRDVQQSAYMKEYLKNGKGKVFYICGSMQRAAVAAGYALHDDITHITQAPHRLDGGPVMLEVVAEPNSELAIAAGSERFKTSNYHHAAVNADEQKAKSVEAKITAYNIEPDGSRGKVVKSIEFANNAGFATQFHAEFEGSSAEKRIVDYVAMGWKLRGRYAPSHVAACLEQRLLRLVPPAK